MLPLIAGAMALGGAAIGNAKANADREQVASLIQQQILDLEKIGIPSVEAQKLILERYRSAGQLTPELEAAIAQTDSELGKIQLDPGTKQAQLEALNALKQISDEGGLQLADKANLANIQNEVAASQKGSRDAILQNMRARGMAGSGLELAAQLQNQQAGAQQANANALSVAAQAQQRALQALLERGNLATNVRGQEFDQEAKKAAAQDIINQFNTNNRQDVQQRNVAARNSAQQANLNNAQQIMNANTGLSNEEQAHNKALQQQYYNNQLNLASAKGNARSRQATNLNQNAARTEGMWAGIGQGAEQAINAFGQHQREQERQDKTDARYNDYKNRVYGPTSR